MTPSDLPRSVYWKELALAHAVSMPCNVPLCRLLLLRLLASPVGAAAGRLHAVIG
jgi:hypothetical protein